MLYIKLNAAGQGVAIEADYPVPAPQSADWARQPGSAALGAGWCNRNDFDSMAVAQSVAASLSENLGVAFIATDAGPHCHPQFDVIEAPVVGAEVSYAFNGDSYPCGKIAKISDSLRRVETDSGKVFYRRKESGSWLHQGWSMVAGHVSKWNPSF